MHMAREVCVLVLQLQRYEVDNSDGLLLTVGAGPWIRSFGTDVGVVV